MSVPRFIVSKFFCRLGLLFMVLELTGALLHGQEKPFDEVVVHGTTLKGQVVAIEPKGLRFRNEISRITKVVISAIKEQP